MSVSSILPASPLYNIPLTDIDGNATSLKIYQGKVLLLVNVASRCGFTRQYAGLEKLYQSKKDSGLIICGFPCNQFGEQEPGSDEDIKQFCTLNYGVSFPMFSKLSVNGADRHPLYKFLLGDKSRVKWNFTKILVDRDGNVVGRFGSLTSPSSKKLATAMDRALKP
ncbi:MAG: glutathione peroxidase [Opitutales bacterium]|nr:glutathione peroxidase [Opitutales bacterium]